MCLTYLFFANELSYIQITGANIYSMSDISWVPRSEIQTVLIVWLSCNGRYGWHVYIRFKWEEFFFFWYPLLILLGAVWFLYIDLITMFHAFHLFTANLSVRLWKMTINCCLFRSSVNHRHAKLHCAMSKIKSTCLLPCKEKKNCKAVT